MGLAREAFFRTVKPPYVRGRDLGRRALERRAGIRTQDRVTLEELGLAAEHRVHYEPSPWLALRRVLSVRDVSSDDVLVDLGSGMGRIVYQAAARYPFRRVIGVELSRRLHEIAVANVTRNRHRLQCQDVQLVCADALEFEIPDDVTVVYMHNPFTGPVFAAVVERLVASVRRNPRRLRLLYTNPLEEAALREAGFRRTRVARGFRPGKEWSRSNSTRAYELCHDNTPPEANRDHWQSIGADYDAEWQPPARRRLGQRELTFILEGLRASRGRTALDVGIGSGRILDGLVRATDKTVFSGVDIAQAMVEATRRRFDAEPRVRELRVCDVSREPLPFVERFDFVSAIRMLKYNANWREIVAKLVDRLEPGGVIVFSTANAHSLNALSRPYAISGVKVTRGEVRRLCEQLELDVLQTAGFIKLPHFLYTRARSPFAARAVLAADAALERLIGGPPLAREFFVAARRR